MTKRKLIIKQKNQMKKRKQQKQIDSNNLRAIIATKKEWAINELKRGKTQLQTIQNTMNQLEGILLFIQDLLEPMEKEGK